MLGTVNEERPELEAQETGDADREERIEDYVRSLADRRLWDEP